LIQIAKRQNKQDEMVDLLFKKYNEEGENIGIINVLKECAKQVKLDIVGICVFMITFI
jgi:predicted DsbA family dithiol-disulfide isomerase